MCGDMMAFPDTVEEFMEQYKMVDREQIYSNGCEYVPIYRMKQWFAHKPQIDIVRCGECKWWVKDGNDSFGYAMFCEHDCSLGGQGIKKPTDFCSYGERRTDDQLKR